MVYGYVNTGYVSFLINDEPEAIEEAIENIIISIKIEEMIKDSAALEEEIWDL